MRSRHRGTPAAAFALALVVVAATSACAHYPRTVPLPASNPPPARYAFDDVAGTGSAGDAQDDLFVCLAFSGGGTRAAALAYGVLEKLRDTRIVRPKDGRSESLLDEVDCISSVSGGSFTSAYYALFGARIFKDFRSSFLDRDIQGELLKSASEVSNWLRLLSPYFSRIDIASELYGASIFEQKVYGDLHHRPYVIVNGTDMTSGEDFEFTQDQFDLLGSDLGAFPIARAVAASSAFPFLLTPVSLVNHPEPPWYAPPLELKLAKQDYYVNRGRYLRAVHQAAYLDKIANPYIHVMDGGLADNTGVRAIARELWEPTGFIGRRVNQGKISKLIVIAVDAKNGPPQTLNQHESAPGLFDVAFKTATVAMDNATSEIIELLRDQGRRYEQNEKIVAKCKTLARDAKQCPSFVAPVEIHVVDVALDGVADETARKRLLSVGTNFSLPKEEVTSLIAAGGQLLEKNPDFQALLATLGATPAATQKPAPAAAKTPTPAPTPSPAPAP